MQDLNPIMKYLDLCDAYYIIATKGPTHMSALDSIYDNNEDMYHALVGAMLGSIEKSLKDKEMNASCVLIMLHEVIEKHFPETHQLKKK